MTERWLVGADGVRPGAPTCEGRSRAALITAMAAGIPLFHEHLLRTGGVDIFAPEGQRLTPLVLLDLPGFRPSDAKEDSTAASLTTRPEI